MQVRQSVGDLASFTRSGGGEGGFTGFGGRFVILQLIQTRFLDKPCQ